MRSDARVKIAILLAALLLGLGSHHALTPLAIALLSAASVIVTAGRAGARKLAGVLAGVAFTAGLPVALLAWTQGPWPALLVAARVLAAACAGTLLLTSTTLPELSRALTWLRVPRALVELVGLAHRQVTVFRDVLETAHDAQRLRLGWTGLSRSLRSLGVLAGFVFGRAIDHAEVLSSAMALRGYRGQWPEAAPSRLRPGDARLAILAAAALLACAWLPSLTGVS